MVPGLSKGTCDFIRRTREWANDEIEALLQRKNHRLRRHFFVPVRADKIVEHLQTGLPRITRSAVSHLYLQVSLTVADISDV
jgi:hypothetical protein